MKIIVCILLALTGAAGQTFAQEVIREVQPVHKTITEWTFDSRPANFDRGPGQQGKISFLFDLDMRNRMLLELSDISQIDSIPDLDSLLQAVWIDLQPFRDSLDIPLNTKRVDYQFNPYQPKMRTLRILQHRQKGEIFRLMDTGITQLKLEQDTLRLRLMTKWKTIIINNNSSVMGRDYYITLYLNNISDLQSLLQKHDFNQALRMVKDDLALPVNRPKKNYNNQYYGRYSLVTGKRIFNIHGKLINNERKRSTISPPYVQMSIQYIRGAWAGSAATGLGVVKRADDGSYEKNWRLLWEPYFFFSRDEKNSLITNRNDFISFKYSEESTYQLGTKEISWKLNASIGYLVRRKGNWFQPYTVKFSVPGLQVQNFQLEPEFVFNKFFRNFSPSLKATMFFR
jgi:hypothetical protein